MNAPSVQAGTRLLLHYTARTTEGGIYETSRNREPLMCTAGSNSLIPGISRAITGLTPGEKTTVTLAPEEAFGVRRPEREQKVPRSTLPDHIAEGDQLSVTTDDEVIDAWVRSLTDEFAVVDANHPLAGETLVFELEVVGIEDPED